MITNDKASHRRDRNRSRALPFAIPAKMLVESTISPSKSAKLTFRHDAEVRMSHLTPRQRQVLALILAGHASKNIAFVLHISQRTVEYHRASITTLLGAKSLPGLVHAAVCGSCVLNLSQKTTHQALLVASKPLLPSPAESSDEINISIHDVSDRHDIPPSIGLTSTESVAVSIDVQEVQHRVRNMIAIIQSISRQTMGESATKEDFDRSFSARLSAFCSSLDRLIANDWHGMEIHDLVRVQLAPFGGMDDGRISVAGPSVELTAAAAYNIGLALHELATNAMKYGALSSNNGRVVLAWQLVQYKKEKQFQFTWAETGGPTVNPPVRRGLGRKMMEQLTAMSLNGSATYEFLPAGVRWTIDIPASTALVK